MKAKGLHLTINTPHGLKFDGDVDAVRLITGLGQIEVRPDHEPMIMTLDIGAANLISSDSQQNMALNLGYVEILDNRVEIVSESAEASGDIDVERAQRSKARAEEQLAELDPSTDIERYKQVENRIHRANVRIAVAAN
ncbi:MAG: ATP synthase F1 subunit epsilon [Myxococcales bacterium]|nr:ATP synthase F1 subunit epsilon [Myxococcales bacterium]